MKRSQRLQAIVSIKAQQASKALTVATEAQHKLNGARQQLEHLQRYRQTYLANDAAQACRPIQRLVEFRAFLAKLDQAILGQTDIVRQLEQDYRRKQEYWTQLHHNKNNLQKVCDALVVEELKLISKREQLEADDRAAAMALLHTNNTEFI